ncbi:MAG: ComEC/Rec2 family competence protein, partial [Candidatus Saganbacteria bacterium]|nr:ComEC/Rec2 family competence protein [Candidatus Saganbacteria bacterium]
MNRPLLVIALVYIALIILLRPIIDQPLKPFKDQKVDLVGIVDSEPVFKDRNVSFYLKIISGAGGRIRASVSKFDAAYGDKIGASGKLSYEKGPRNPGLPERAYVSFLSFDVPNVISRGHGNPILRLAFFIRKKLLDSVKKIMPSPYSDLLSGILFGKAAATIPDEIKEQFKKTGTVHILVVSGMHLSILIGVCLTILKSSRLPLWASTLIATLINLLYVLAAGAGASVIRAGIMAEAAMMGQIVDRERDFFTTLSAAALFLLIINPLSLFQIGFQLSFAATISLVYLAPVIRDIIVGVGRGRMPDWFAQLISISIAPMLMTAPIILYNFSQLSLVTVVVNAMIIPWISYLLILGFAAALIGNIFLPLAQILGGTLFLMLRLLHLIVGFFAGLPFACVFFRPPSFILIVAYYVGMGWLIYRLQNGLKLKITKKTILIASLIFLILFVWNAALAPASQLGGK